MSERLLDRLLLRRGDEHGFVAMFAAISFASFMFGCAALGVDVARLYLEGQRVQRAADAGALGGVTYLPQDLDNAIKTARDISSRNGYPNAGTSVVTADYGDRKSQLKVTVCSKIDLNFAVIFGIGNANVCRSATADYTGPAPMGSPCNTFGNEPSGGGGSSSPSPATGTAQAPGTSGKTAPFPNCKRNPQMWAEIEGPETDKVQGDRFQTLNCDTGTSVDKCDSSKNNLDYDQAGYFYLVHVEPNAVGKTVDLQLYDPAFVYTSGDCSDTPDAGDISSDSLNNYVKDAKTRYSVASAAAQPSMCPGDNFPGGVGAAMTTSFALRQQSDTLNPRTAPVQKNTSGDSCVKQYYGVGSTLNKGRYYTYNVDPNWLNKSQTNYYDELAQEFHNWVSFCKFTPSRSGDYYLQVRSNVSLAGTPSTNKLVYSGNDTNVLAANGNTTTGAGANGFGIRAVMPSGNDTNGVPYQNLVSVSAYNKLAMYQNATSSTANFNLIRVLPGAAGKAISFSYFDVGDSDDGTGSVKVQLPDDAKNNAGTVNYSTSADSVRFPGGCTAFGGNAQSGKTYSNCSADFSNGSNNGKIETISIPIPTDYTCDYTTLGGCWYRVQVTFSGTNPVHDTTTWTADIVGQPVRLIE